MEMWRGRAESKDTAQARDFDKEGRTGSPVLAARSW